MLEDEICWHMQWGGPILFSHGTSSTKGVCVLLSNRIAQTTKCTNKYADPEGHFIIIQIETENKPYLISNVNGPNTDKPEFYQYMLTKVTEHSESELLMLGDFNLVLDLKLDRTENIQYQAKSHAILVDYMETNDLLDLWRCKNPDQKPYSWIRKNPKVTGSSIDFAIFSPGFANYVSSLNYSPGYKTDHSMLTCEISFCTYKRGRGY